MTAHYTVGDSVTWRSQAGDTHGTVTKVHVKDVEFMGKHRPASEDAPQYEVKSDKTGHSALHHGDALRKC
jgi:hypothetical protein